MSERFFPASVRIVGDIGLTDEGVLHIINRTLGHRSKILATLQRVLGCSIDSDTAEDVAELLRFFDDGVHLTMLQLHALDPAQFVSSRGPRRTKRAPRNGGLPPSDVNAWRDGGPNPKRSRRRP